MMTEEQTEFRKVFLKIQQCAKIQDEIIISFFNKTFEDLILRMDDKGDDGITEEILSNFLDLPLLISGKIFNSFITLSESRKVKNSQRLTKQRFARGMLDLYFSPFEVIKNSVFKIFLNEGQAEIMIEDVKLILLYLNNHNSEGDLFIKDVDKYVDEFFCSKNSLTLEEYSQKIINENSNLFIIILILLVNRQNFTEEAINYYINNCMFEKIQQKNNLVPDKELFDFIYKPSFELNFYMKFVGKPFKGTKRRFGSKNVLNNDEALQNRNICDCDLNYGEMYEICKCESQGQYMTDLPKSITKVQTNESINTLAAQVSLTPISPSKFSTQNKKIVFSQSNTETNTQSNTQINTQTNTQRNTKSNLENIIQNINTSSLTSSQSAYVYKLSSENKLKKHRLVLIDKELFSFKYFKVREGYIFDRLFPLSGYFATSCESSKINDINFYAFALLAKHGNTKANLSNIFFMKSKEKHEEFVNVLKKAMNIKDLEDQYEVGKDLGQGQYGKVKLGTDKETGENVAIKFIKKSKLTEKEVKIVKAEVDVMQFLRTNTNENVVRCIDVYEDKNYIYIVMEHLKGGSLDSFLKSRGKLLSSEEIKLIANQLALALKFIHKNGIIHRDIKTDNIMLTYNDLSQIKLVDFGLSKVLTKNDSTCESFGTLVYSSPEILLKTPYNNKVDVWSFGILIYFLLTGFYPFDGDGVPMSEIAARICSQELTFPTKFKVPNNLKMYVKYCLQKKSLQRLDISQLMDMSLL